MLLPNKYKGATFSFNGRVWKVLYCTKVIWHPDGAIYCVAEEGKEEEGKDHRYITEAFLERLLEAQGLLNKTKRIYQGDVSYVED